MKEYLTPEEVLIKRLEAERDAAMACAVKYIQWYIPVKAVPVLFLIKDMHDADMVGSDLAEKLRGVKLPGEF